MRQTLSKGMVAAAAATSILSLCGGPALADTHTGGAAKDSPGVLSGNSVEAPLDVPVNACGNSVDVVAALNPAFGNSCAEGQDTHGRSHGRHHGHDAYGDDDSGYGSDDDCEDSGYGYGDSCGGDHTPPPGGDHTPPPGGDHTPPPGGDHTPPPGGDHTPPPGGDHTPPPGGDHTPPPGGDHTPPPGGDHTPPPGGDHTPPPGGDHTPPPGGDHTPPPGGDHTPPPYTPPPGGGDHTPPPSLPHTGSEAMLGASGVSAAMIVAGAVLYRRGRAGSHR
ncbi:chaplin family protein [Streptomyces pseudovenezuelae]|uniref:Chaplin domain-containing protein n=1 Tax=Streptomyces pseudovenezuelae TaxID=67350 RepID=A0ABT6LHN8_9ACTN|nr:chaplin family protein [Streptomyces pseudovenezuelae]MDH6215826.1 hypothetical protein [Streptomyces pseudovenezuelae]